MEVHGSGSTMPAVLIGDAAHAVPEDFSPGDIVRASWDAIDLCSMIVLRYDDDKLSFSIPRLKFCEVAEVSQGLGPKMNESPSPFFWFQG